MFWVVVPFVSVGGLVVVCGGFVELFRGFGVRVVGFGGGRVFDLVGVSGVSSFPLCFPGVVSRFLRGFVVWVGGEFDFLVPCGDLVYFNTVPFSVQVRSCLRDFLEVSGVVRGLLGLGGVRFCGVGVVCSGFLRRLLGFGEVVYPPVDLVVGSVSRGVLGLKGRVVVCVCRFRRGKGVFDVPRVARLVRGCRFFIFTVDDPVFRRLYPEFVRLCRVLGVRDRVRVFVDVPKSVIRRVLDRACVYFSPSRFESFGISIVEGMFRGCVPVVYRFSGGPWYDILGERQGVFGFAYSDVEEAAQYISELVEDKSRFRELATAAMSRAELFTFSRFRSRVLEVLERYYPDVYRLLVSSSC